MRSHDVPGFILRTEAVKKYGRSKASFIRDFDKAFESGDTDFLNNFRLYLNDGSVIEGPDASKEKMLSLQSKQPWVYIRESFLEGRYWEGESAGSSSKPKSERQSKEEGSPVSKLSGATDALQLEHENTILKTKLAAQEQTIETLRDSNSFLQDELKNRRGELREMTNLVDSMRLGLEAGKQAQSQPPPSQQTDSQQTTRADVVDVNSSWWSRNTPTFHRVFHRRKTRS